MQKASSYVPLTERLSLKKTKRKDSFFRDVAKNKFSYLIALPALIYVFVFSYCSYPYMVIAFQEYNFRTNIFNSKWVGLKNFEFFFKSNYAFTVTWNTIYLNLLFIITGTFVSVLLALMLNELKSKWFIKFAQSSMLFPNYISWVVVSYILFSFLSTEYGFLNRILTTFGAERVNWYLRPELWRGILVFTRIWKSSGINAVIFLAAIAGIDESQYEAAAIDGATRLQQTKSITIPLIMPTILIMTLLSVGKVMYGDFGMIYAMIGDNGVLYPTTDIIDTYVFRALRQIGDPSQAMAIGLFQSVVGFIMVFGSNKLTKKVFPEGALF
ncbi:MAG: ABC transporter permease subunit [Ruminiclostridium sp.]|nr:ABC transporter permease subunit [Ruminiclostridium sp.]